MPGMNKSSRTIQLIERSLHRLETDASSSSLDALGVLDEIRRLEKKWREQVAGGSPRRIEADFETMKGWLRRWILAASAIEAKEPGEKMLKTAIGEVEVAISKMKGMQ
jgi:hypothetical protein